MKKNLRIWIYSLVVIGGFVMLTNGCLKNEDKNDPVVTDLDDLTDIDGNVYTSVTIGTQVWMVENLKTTKYRNGDPIEEVKDNSAWAALTTGAQCNFNNLEANGNKYGKIYNWHAVKDSRKIAPNGWHIPSDAEWTTLTNYLATNLGASSSIVKAMAAQTDWVSSSAEDAIGNDLTKNNSSGFTALPGGIRGLNGPSGIFGWLRTDAWFWSTSETDASFASARGMKTTDQNNMQTGMFFKTDGLSVRCIKD